MAASETSCAVDYAAPPALTESPRQRTFPTRIRLRYDPDGKRATMYSDKVMDHFMNPRNVGDIEAADGVGQVGNAKCGDIMKIYLKIEDGIIKDAKFKTFGCGAAVATSSMATELIIGKTIEEAEQITNKAVMEALDGLPPAKVHCSVLAEEAIAAALADYREKHGLSDGSGSGCSGCCGSCGHDHHDLHGLEADEEGE